MTGRVIATVEVMDEVAPKGLHMATEDEPKKRSWPDAQLMRKFQHSMDSMDAMDKSAVSPWEC